MQLPQASPERKVRKRSKQNLDALEARARLAEQERWRLEAQTERNVAGSQAEQAGHHEEACALYERNTQEGFPGDWPYARLVALYEKTGALDDVERILERAIVVFGSSRSRTPADRRAMVAIFRRRLRELRKRRKSQSLPPAPAERQP